MFSVFQRLFKVLNAKVHIGNHVCVLCQIVHYGMHNAFALDQILNAFWDFVFEEFLALTEHTPSRPRCLALHQLHCSVVAA